MDDSSLFLYMLEFLFSKRDRDFNSDYSKVDNPQYNLSFLIFTNNKKNCEQFYENLEILRSKTRQKNHTTKFRGRRKKNPRK